jgi:hypothetical protein
MTLADADLERLLSIAAGEYPVPEDGIDRVLAVEAEQRHDASRLARLGSWRPTNGLLVAAASIVIIAGLGFGVAHLPSHHTAAKSPPTATAAIAGGVPAAPPSAAASPFDLMTGQGAIRTAPQAAPGVAAAAGPAHAPAAAGTLVPIGVVGSVPAAAQTQLVRTGHATLTVGKGGVPAAQQKLEVLAAQDDGIVAKEDTTGGSSPSATLTLRVPGDQYQDLVTGVRALGTVTDLSTQTTDVTSQYTDLAARIKALQTTRDTYLTILSKATSIGDTLSVQQRLDDVQSQLEQLQGQQKVLADQTALGTLEVTVTEKAASIVVPPPPHRSGPWDRAWQSARHRFADGIRWLVVATGPLAFVLMLAGIGFLGWRGGRRFWRRAQV